MSTAPTLADVKAIRGQPIPVPLPDEEVDPISSRGFLYLPAAVALNTPREPRSLGIAALDDLLAGGLGKGEAVVIGGGPGSGKTTILCRAAAVLASPTTALLVVAHDEYFARVARKVATSFNEAYSELTADYPSVLRRLEEKLAKRSSFLVFDDARTGRPLDTIVEAFAEIVPKDRDVYVLVDHIHAVDLATFEDRDCDTQRIEKVAAFIASLTRREWAVLSLSEVTKAALSPNTVREAPLSAFAGSRKIASRADAAIVAVPDDHIANRFHWIAAKTRFGPKASRLVDLNPITWTFSTVDVKDLEAQAQAAVEEKQARTDLQDEIAVLETIRERKSLGLTTSRNDLKDALHPIRKERLLRAVTRLMKAESVKEEPGPPRSTGGPRGSVLVEVKRETAEVKSES